MIRPVRDIALPLGLLGTAALLGWQIMTIVYVVVGYAHFIQGYWYRVRAHRESYIYLGIAPLAVAGTVSLYFYIGGGVELIFIMLAPLFAAHFAFDEFFLHGETVDGWRAAIPWAFIGIDFFLTLGLMLPELRVYAFGCALLVLLGIAARFAYARNLITSTEQYLGFVTALLFLLASLGSAELVFATIVLLHCYNWYDWGHTRALTKPGGVWPYWRDTGLILGLMCALCLLALSGSVPRLEPVFSVSNYFYYYFPIALAHLATSIRFT